MRSSSLFFILVLIFANVQAHAVEGQCFDLFVKAELKPFAEQRSRLEPWDLKRAGVVYTVKDSKGLQEQLDLLQERDGTFPLLMDNQGNTVISHRLPNNQPGQGAPYLGTHRGLYLVFKESLGYEPQIVFAGQIRVIAGKTVSLVDQAGTFYDLETDMKGDPSVTSLREQLIESNQQRIDFATNQLEKMGIIDAKTAIFNFKKRAGNNTEGPVDGHIAAKEAAQFEIQCRANPKCWSQFLKIEVYLKKISALGGNAYISQSLSRWLGEWGTDVFALFQIMGMISAEGTLDVMAMDQMLEPGTARGQMFQKFYDQLDTVLGDHVGL